LFPKLNKLHADAPGVVTIFLYDVKYNNMEKYSQAKGDGADRVSGAFWRNTAQSDVGDNLFKTGERIHYR
jgi:hypothetical protein